MEMRLTNGLINLKRNNMEQTLEEAAENYSKGWGEYDDKKAFIAGAKSDAANKMVNLKL